MKKKLIAAVLAVVFALAVGDLTLRDESSIKEMLETIKPKVEALLGGDEADAKKETAPLISSDAKSE